MTSKKLVCDGCGSEDSFSVDIQTNKNASGEVTWVRCTECGESYIPGAPGAEV